jgi:hypothetical protein
MSPLTNTSNGISTSIYTYTADAITTHTAPPSSTAISSFLCQPLLVSIMIDVTVSFSVPTVTITCTAITTAANCYNYYY